MAYWYKDKKEEWREFISLISQETGQDILMIEKDTIQSILLDKLFASNESLVFKGGTSLSKGYGIIDRFSEDIDITCSVKLTQKEKKSLYRVLLDIAEEYGLELEKGTDNIWERSDFCRYPFLYDSLFDEQKQSLKVETVFRQISYPVDKITVSSIVSKFCKEKNLDMPIDFPSADIIISVQSLERTFIDKVFAICDYYIGNNVTRNSRHLYDIAILIKVIDMDKDYSELIAEVRADRDNPKYKNYSAQEQYNITDLLKEIISKEVFRADYENLTLKLLYSPMGYEEAVKNGIQIVADKDMFGKRYCPMASGKRIWIPPG